MPQHEITLTLQGTVDLPAQEPGQTPPQGELLQAIGESRLSLEERIEQVLAQVDQLGPRVDALVAAIHTEIEAVEARIARLERAASATLDAVKMLGGTKPSAGSEPVKS